MSIKNLIFEGGGVKGSAYGGALMALDRLKILQGIKRVAGTSAGAITAVLLAVGYAAEELAEIVAEMDFEDFKDDSVGVFRDTARMLTDFGWHKGDYFLEWMGSLMTAKVGRPDITFKDLHEMDNTLDLYLTGTNLSKQQVEIFSYEHTPDMTVCMAARISMSIPFFFQAVFWGKDKDVMVDGGVAYNYPIDIFDKRKYVPEAGPGKEDDYIFNHQTLGLRVDSTREISLGGLNKGVPVEISNIVDHASALTAFYIDQINKRHLKKRDYERTVFVDTLDLSAVGFETVDELEEELQKNGSAGIHNFFNTVTA